MVSHVSFATEKTDTTRVKDHLKAITKTEKPRNYRNVEQLNNIANYIHKVFSQYSNRVSFQEFEVKNKTYKNVICSFGPENKERIIIGAHYDVSGNQEGADDNASGVVGLLELSRLFKGKTLKYRIDLVAYSLEEPPFFRTEYMGSYIHAKSINSKDIDVLGMIAIEMIGYFKEERKTQKYPLGILSLFYGNRGDYITLVKKFGSGKFPRKFSRRYKSTKAIRTKKFKGPKSLQGIDFSDHLNYWKFGFNALMITGSS